MSFMKLGALGGMHEAKAKSFMIATQGKHTTQIAMDVIKDGGNIIDAAIAASFAIGVERLSLLVLVEVDFLSTIKLSKIRFMFMILESVLW